MDKFILLFSAIGSVFMGFGLTIDTNPSLCISLRVKSNLKKNSILRKVFPGKETRLHPYSYLRILPLAISCIINVVILPVYLIYFGFNIVRVNELVESNLFYILGIIVLLIYFIYPIIIMLVNQIFKFKEKLMDVETKNQIYKIHEEYYKRLENL